jgi:hypothetical protein
MPLSGRLLKNRLTAAFLLIGGVVLILAGAWIAIINANFTRHAEKAPGTVINVVGERGARGATLYHPVVRYRPRQQDNSVTFKANPGMLWSSPFDVDDPVTVAYNEDDPEDAKIVSFWMLWLLPITLILFGAGCLLAGWKTLAKTV